MVSTTDLMAEHQVETGLTGQLLEEEVAFLYTGIRLKAILPKINSNNKEFDNLCNAIVEQFTNNDYSLDCMINAVYNYINTHKFSPPISCINDDIEIFLNKYCIAIQHFTKRSK